MNKRLGVIGAGGHGKIAADIAQRTGWKDIVFFDERFSFLDSQYHAHWPLIAVPEGVIEHQCDGYFVAIGNGKVRQQWCEWLISKGLPLVSLLDPSAVVSRYATIEQGVLVAAASVVNVDSHLSQGVIINTGARIDHDCSISSYTHICPAATLAGTVTVGAHSWVGIGSQIIQNIFIGNNVIIGGGATVINNVSDDSKVVGTPAVPI